MSDNLKIKGVWVPPYHTLRSIQARWIKDFISTKTEGLTLKTPQLLNLKIAYTDDDLSRLHLAIDRYINMRTPKGLWQNIGAAFTKFWFRQKDLSKDSRRRIEDVKNWYETTSYQSAERYTI